VMRTAFICDYLSDADMRKEVGEALQVVENWNSANSDPFYGKDDDLTGSDKESWEVSMLALHLLQSALLVHVNTLLLQDILSEEKWQKRLTDADRRALSPLFWTHLNPFVRFELDMTCRLDLDLDLRPPGPQGPACTVHKASRLAPRAECRGHVELNNAYAPTRAALRRSKHLITAPAEHNEQSLRVRSMDPAGTKESSTETPKATVNLGAADRRLSRSA
jgi:hypothetical protein